MLKETVKNITRHLGYKISRISRSPESCESVAYEPVRPIATYSPWNKDALFQEVYAEIQPFTLVDKYRCFELWSLVAQSSKLQTGCIIEVGVWRGGTGALIAKQAELREIKDKVYLCDTFTGVVKAGLNDKEYKGGEHANTTRRVVEKLIHRKMKLDNVEILEGVFPDQTGSDIERMVFRFCHIDVDVYQSAKDIIDWIWDRMVSGGIIVFDDYGFQCCEGITKYVEELMYVKDRVMIHNLNGHAVLLKL